MEGILQYIEKKYRKIGLLALNDTTVAVAGQ